jgi:glycosyltransferase involved in cell wall biosynthesis
VKLFRNTKVLLICDNVIPHEKRFGDKLFTKLVFSIVNYFIVQSKTVEKDLIKFNKSNKPYKLSPHPLYNIFGEKLDKEEAKKYIEKNYDVKFDTDKVILFFGYIRKYKGLMYLLEAMPEILKKKNVKLLIAGEFYDDEKPYKEKIKELKLESNILLLSDFMPDDEVRYFFSACDCLVLPYTDATQSGIVQIAYYYDKPVVVTDVGGLSEVVISEKTGIIINPGSVNEVSSAVIRFYDENLEGRFTENIKTEKLKYSWDVFVDNVMKLAGK